MTEPEMRIDTLTSLSPDGQERVTQVLTPTALSAFEEDG